MYVSSLCTMKVFLPNTIFIPKTSSFFLRDLVQQLRSRGTAVYLISGGFKQLLEPVVEHLGILNTHVYANRLLFRDNGEYIA